MHEQRSSNDQDPNSAPGQADAMEVAPDADQGAGALIPGAEPPSESRPADVRERMTTAGGWTAVYQSMRHALPAMGAKRTIQTLLKVNQKEGFDCPSCAWPDPDGHRSLAEFCENGAKAVAAEATLARVTPEFFAEYSIDDLARQSDRWLDAQGRLTHPMILRPGATHYAPIEWGEAFEVIARELNALVSPDEASFYTSGRTSNEAAFLYQLFVRLFGTNNLPDCSNMCHESSGLGLTESIGIGKGTVTLEDFDHADAIFVIGQNPGTNHPRMLSSLQRAARRGCKIVSVNPLPETGMIRFKHPQEPIGMLGGGTPIASLFVPVRINGDVALLKGIMKRMLEEDDRRGRTVLAYEFIRDKTEGFDALATDLRDQSWETIVQCSGVPRALIDEAAEIAIESERTIHCWAMGITQHKNGVANVRNIANLALMRGQIGRRGAGLCPVRGHSNVQGDRTMGVWEKASDAFIAALGKEFDFSPPTRHGFDTVHTIKAMHDGRVKVFFGLGGNFLSAAPDTQYTAKAMTNCRLTVQVSTKLNRGHLITGRQAIILPCLGRTERDVRGAGEQFVTVEDSMGVVHASRGVLAPASDRLLSEVAIVAGVARATLKDRTTVSWESLSENYDLIRDRIERVIPGFERYNERVRKPGGFYLPNGPREGTFTTRTGRAHFSVDAIPESALLLGQLLLMTLRSHDQFNTTVYGDDDRYRGVYGGRRVVFLNEQDIAERGLEAGDCVDLIGHFEGERRRAAEFKVVPYPIPRGCAGAYFPETNALVPVRSVADGSNQPTSKSVVITIEHAVPAAKA